MIDQLSVSIFLFVPAQAVADNSTCSLSVDYGDLLV